MEINLSIGKYKTMKNKIFRGYISIWDNKLTFRLFIKPSSGQFIPHVKILHPESIFK